VVLSRDGRIKPEHFPRPRAMGALPHAPTSDTVTMAQALTLEEASKRYAEATLEACGRNKTEAARRLGISRNRLGRMLKGTD
jgi:DNA-binding NtrC family response regulator